MRHILIIEDHEDTRLWWLEHLAEVFSAARLQGVVTCEEARRLLAAVQYDLALIDINLPDGSGIDLVREIKQKTPSTHCVISTTFDDDGHIFDALRAGAEGYLIKDQPHEEQILQLRKVLDGEPPLSPGVAGRILSFFTAPAARDEGFTEKLTRRECDVLQLLAKGYSRPETAEILGLSNNTVASYTKVIYQKLDVSRRAEAVVEALRLGLISSK